MALNASTVWEIRAEGSSTGGSGFVDLDPGTSIDYSQQDSPEFSPSDLASNGAGTGISSAVGGFTAAMVGNVMHITATGSFTFGWYQIIAYTDTNNITIDRSAGVNKSGGQGYVGGAYNWGGDAYDYVNNINKEGGNNIWMKSGSYTLGESTSTSDTSLTVKGYTSVRGDVCVGDDRPLLNMGSTKYMVWSTGCRLENIRFIGSDNSILINLGQSGLMVNCKVTQNYNTISTSYACVTMGTEAKLISCEFIAPKCSGVSSSSDDIFIDDCYIHNCHTGIRTNTGVDGGYFRNNIIANCLYGIWTQDRVHIENNTVRGCMEGIYCEETYKAIVRNNLMADCFIGLKWLADPRRDYNFIDYNGYSNNDTDLDTISVKGDNSVTDDAEFDVAVIDGSDGVTDGAGTAFTAASNPFGTVTTNDYIVIVEAGTGATLGVFSIVAVVGPGELTLGESAGASKTGISYKIVTSANFTINDVSDHFGAGLSVSTFTGATI